MLPYRNIGNDVNEI